MNRVYAFCKNGASAAQPGHVDEMVLGSQSSARPKVRGVAQNLLTALNSINGNTADSQILAAVTLILMNLSPVISVQSPFGGDNHSDGGLATETAETITGVATIKLAGSAQLQTGRAVKSKVAAFASLNVFGRTLLTNGTGPATDGRNHNPNHQVSLAIGKPFLGGVIGGVARVGNDYGATAIQSADGSSSSRAETSRSSIRLGAFAQTVVQAVGGDPTVINRGKPITNVLA